VGDTGFTAEVTEVMEAVTEVTASILVVIPSSIPANIPANIPAIILVTTPIMGGGTDGDTLRRSTWEVQA